MDETGGNAMQDENNLEMAFFAGGDEDAPMSDDALSDDDTGDLPIPVRRTITRLLKEAYVCNLESPTDFQTIQSNRADVARALANLGLSLHMSERYGCAWATQANVAGKSPLFSLKTPLPLNRDTSMLLVSLRIRQHAQETRGEENWFVDREELEDVLKSGPYVQDRDGARVAKAASQSIEKLCSLGYLKAVTGAQDRYRIMPVLPAVFGLERARELLAAFNRVNANSQPREKDAT